MPQTIQNLDRVPAAIRGAVEELCQLLGQLAGPGLRSVDLFGPATGGEYRPDRQSASSVVVVEPVDLHVLRQLAQHGRGLAKRGLAAPLVLTPAYIAASCDTFPLELIEIHQSHLPLVGNSYFAELTVDDAHVRLQAERDLKAMLLGLRQGLLSSGGRTAQIAEIDKDIAAGLLRTLRGLLWIRDLREPRSATIVVAEAERILERQLTGVRQTLDPAGEHGWEEFCLLHADLEALQAAVDRW